MAISLVYHLADDFSMNVHSVAISSRNFGRSLFFDLREFYISVIEGGGRFRPYDGDLPRGESPKEG